MNNWENAIDKKIEEKKALLDTLRECGYLNNVIEVAKAMEESLKNGGKVLTAGNGGSAADAQHFTGEIVGRFLRERDALAAISLVVDPVVMTCLGNDYGYNEAIARQIKGLGKKGDVFLAVSTSGNSDNLNNAIEAAKRMGIKTVGLTGKTGGMMKDICDYTLIVPSDSTPRIQEIHTFTVHLLCEMIEADIFGENE